MCLLNLNLPACQSGIACGQEHITFQSWLRAVSCLTLRESHWGIWAGHQWHLLLGGERPGKRNSMSKDPWMAQHSVFGAMINGFLGGRQPQRDTGNWGVSQVVAYYTFFMWGLQNSLFFFQMRMKVIKMWWWQRLLEIYIVYQLNIYFLIIFTLKKYGNVWWASRNLKLTR